MIEFILKDGLEKRLSVPVWLEQPEQKPLRYVLLEKLSGGDGNWILSASFAVQSYAESLYEAAKLNVAVKRAMKQLVELPNISRISLNSDYNYTDPETKQYRYQAVFDITYMESE